MSDSVQNPNHAHRVSPKHVFVLVALLIVLVWMGMGNASKEGHATQIVNWRIHKTVASYESSTKTWIVFCESGTNGCEIRAAQICGTQQGPSNLEPDEGDFFFQLNGYRRVSTVTVNLDRAIRFGCAAQ
ncbi:hypothetical protein [Shimia biformata]|uniref:hypothetical protein n=1 Tax=Shimia biformata TaxID=1294299 RepID=UPI00195242C8|nr:hypothetical protein [Shimia biformata]